MFAAPKQSCENREWVRASAKCSAQGSVTGVENVGEERMKSLGGSRRDERRFAPTRIGWTR
jgi:hypothetical protein